MAGPSEIRKILVVDDDPAVRRALEIRLTNAGYQVVTASCGEDGLLACAPDPPHVVILDVTMPGMDGYEVCERIRQSVDAPVTVIYLTGVTTNESSRKLDQEIAESGGDYYMVKPYDPSLLIELVNQVIRDPMMEIGGDPAVTETRQ